MHNLHLTSLCPYSLLSSLTQYSTPRSFHITTTTTTSTTAITITIMNVLKSSWCLHISLYVLVIMYHTSRFAPHCYQCNAFTNLRNPYSVQNKTWDYSTSQGTLLQALTCSLLHSARQALASMSPQPPPPRSIEDMEREKAMQQHAPQAHYNLFIYGQWLALRCAGVGSWLVLFSSLILYFLNWFLAYTLESVCFHCRFFCIWSVL